MHLVVAYDVVDDRRRARLAQKLTELLVRVQKSVFQGEVDGDGMEEVLQRIQKEADLSQDSVIVYTLCAHCAKNTHYLGTAPTWLESEDYEII